MVEISKKKRQYSDAQLFVDGLVFLKESSKIIKNMEKDYKIEFGQDFIVDIRDMITNFSLSYKFKDASEKLQYGLEAYHLVEKLDISLRIMMEAGIMAVKQGIQLSLLLGNLILQTKGWIKSIGGNINTDSEPETNNQSLDECRL